MTHRTEWGFAGNGWTLNTSSIVRKGTTGMPAFADPVLTSPSSMATNTTADDYLIDGHLLVPVCPVAGTACDSSLVFERLTTVDGQPKFQPVVSDTLLAATSGEILPSGLAGISLNGWTYFRREIDNGVRYFFSPDGRTFLAQTKSGHVMQYGHPLDSLFSDGLEFADSATGQQLGIGNFPYRWILVRDTDASGNTVYYNYSSLAAVFGQWHPYNGIQYLTDIFDTPDSATGASFAHHVHLTWAPRLAPQTATNPIYQTSPIWRAVPSAHLTTVDVTSATMTSLQRQLVRRYDLSYTTTSTKSRDLLQSVALEGTCAQPIPENSDGLLPAVTGCPSLPPKGPMVQYGYTADSPAEANSDISLTRNIPVVYLMSESGGDAPWATVMNYVFVDANGDGAADLVQGPVSANNLSWTAGFGEPYHFNVDFGPPPLDAPTVTPTNHSNLVFSSQNPSGLNATLKSLSPLPDAAVVYGDWLSNGQVNWLWMNITPGSTTSPGSYEIYTPSKGSLVGTMGGTFPSFTQTGVPDWRTGRALDVDGDGLTDMALVPYTSPGAGMPSQNAYLTRRDRTGATLPFALRALGGGLVDPTAYSSDSQRLFADVDGDGLLDVVIAYRTRRRRTSNCMS